MKSEFTLFLNLNCFFLIELSLDEEIVVSVYQNCVNTVQFSLASYCKVIVYTYVLNTSPCDDHYWYAKLIM